MHSNMSTSLIIPRARRIRKRGIGFFRDFSLMNMRGVSFYIFMLIFRDWGKEPIAFATDRISAIQGST